MSHDTSLECIENQMTALFKKKNWLPMEMKTIYFKKGCKALVKKLCVSELNILAS